jgi:FkbM family methyltransferase
MNIKNYLRRKLIKITGYYFYKYSDLEIGTDLERDLILKLNINPRIMFDVGANYGQTAISYRTIFKDAIIYSFEPFKETYKKLVENTKPFDIICEPIAFGNVISTKNILLNNDSQLNSLNQESEQNEGETIDVQTIDYYCREKNIDQIDVLKIDTEGYELNVLKGAENMIKNKSIKSILCEVSLSPKNTHNSKLVDIINFLFEHNYQMIGLYETNINFYKEGIVYSNVLFVAN